MKKRHSQVPLPDGSGLDKREKEIRTVRENMKSTTEPMWSHEVGNLVVVGQLEAPVVREIIDGGKIYGIETKGTLAYYPWTSVFSDHGDQDHNIIKNRNIRISYQNGRLKSLVHRVRQFGVNMDPSYQRAYVYTPEEREAVIDSIFHNREIGRFLFALKNHPDVDEIVDGKQRLSAILEFCDGRSTYKGFRYHQLSKSERDYFENHTVAVGEIQTDDPIEIRKIFIHVNKNGRIMDPGQIRIVEEEIKSYEQCY